MTSWGGTQRVCASCRYWGGRREVNFSATFFEAKDAKGICNGPSGSFRGVETNQGASCSEWEAYRN